MQEKLSLDIVTDMLPEQFARLPETACEVQLGSAGGVLKLCDFLLEAFQAHFFHDLSCEQSFLRKDNDFADTHGAASLCHLDHDFHPVSRKQQLSQC